MLRKLKSDPNLRIHPNYPNYSDRSHGFTLLEVLLCVAAIGILAGLSLPVARTMLTKNDLDIATVTTAQTLRRAQIQSLAVDGDISWGVKVQSGSITLFKGTNYSSRDSNYDETFDTPTTISFSGVSEVVFSKFSGLPQVTGTTTLTSESDNKSITINSKGGISY